MKKIWRYSHLIVAFFIFAYLLIASVSGAILGVYQALNSAKDTEEITIAQVIDKTSKNYSELVSLKNEDGNLELQAFNEDYDELKGNLDTKTGKIVAKKNQKPKFISDTESFHRSLFLDETGRVLVGIFTLLFMIELITGLFLMLKTVPKFSHLFTKWNYGNFALTYHHSVSRLVFLPLLIIDITGIFLSAYRFKFIEDKTTSTQKFELKGSAKRELKDFPKLKETKTKDLVSLDFPFDETENYQLETKAGKFELDYNSGEVVKQELFSDSKQFQNLSFDIHTGKISSIWAWLIFLVSMTIPGFIISGFMLFAKKRNKKIRGISTYDEAEIVIMYGSENGTTREQALSYFHQFTNDGKKVFLGSLNQINAFPKASSLLILTSTYGDGEAPSNANLFLGKINPTYFNKNINIGILGFGSINYTLFNQFSKVVYQKFLELGFNEKQMVFETVNNRNSEQIINFEEKISQKFGLKINSNKEKSASKKLIYERFTILEKTEISERNHYCQMLLDANGKSFQSGDLLRIKIPNSDEFRYYSISKVGEHISLLCKYLEGGKCSEFWKNLKYNDVLEATIEPNPNFHLQNKHAILICNGTGIAPFLGMINKENVQDISLYAGFRYREELTEKLHSDLKNSQLSELHWVYSGEIGGTRITNLLESDATKLLDHLMNNQVVMICGALALKEEVETIIKNEIKKQNLSITLEDFYLNHLLKADCY